MSGTVYFERRTEENRIPKEADESGIRWNGPRWNSHDVRRHRRTGPCYVQFADDKQDRQSRWHVHLGH